VQITLQNANLLVVPLFRYKTSSRFSRLGSGLGGGTGLLAKVSEKVDREATDSSGADTDVEGSVGLWGRWRGRFCRETTDGGVRPGGPLCETERESNPPERLSATNERHDGSSGIELGREKCFLTRIYVSINKIVTPSFPNKPGFQKFNNKTGSIDS
jgi:hypothetical protein